MFRVRQALSALQSFDGSQIRPGRPADDALIELLAHMAGSDGRIEDAELDMLQGVLPAWTRGQLRVFLDRVLSGPLDLDRLAAAWPTDDERWTALRFAARMAGRDGHTAADERAFLQDLAQVLGLADALPRVLGEVTGPPPERLTPEALLALITVLPWSAANFLPGAVASEDLLSVVPPEATPVMRIGVDHAEVMGVYTQGLVSRFLEGVAYLPWSTIAGWTHGVGLESSVRLHTDDGRRWSLVDSRMAGVALLLDRLFHGDALPPAGTPPTIVRGRATDATWDDAEAE